MELASGEGGCGIEALGFSAGMILPSGPFFGIDDPAVGDAPGVILFAFCEHSADVIVRRKDLDAEKHGLGGVGALEHWRGDDVRYEEFRR